MSRGHAEIVLLANPAAGGGRAKLALDCCVAELARRGVAHRAIVAGDPDDVRRQAAALAGRQLRVVAVGGDGLLRLVAGELAGSGTPLAICPAGRGNDFARVLGIPREPAAAIAIALEGRERTVDLGRVDGKPFLGIASLGFDSLANEIANKVRVVRGQLVYALGALGALAQWRPARFEVVVDGREFELHGYAVAVANSGCYGGGMWLAPHASLFDGYLDVVATAHASRLRLLRNLPRVFAGTHLALPEVITDRGRTVTVISDRSFDVYADGDPVSRSPCTVTVERSSLRVVVAADRAEATVLVPAASERTGSVVRTPGR